MAQGLGGRADLQDRERRSAPEILRARDVPLSVGAHPYGACAQLRHGRRGRALPARARLQRSPSDGLGRVRHAGRERGHAEQHPSGEMDLRQYRRHAGAIAVDGALARLVARDRDLRSELLQASAEAVPRFPQGWPGHAQAIQGQLGPGRPDGARQRAGDRRARVALGRSGRAARAHPMVPQDHRLFRRSARKPRSSRTLAGKSPADAEELDRALGGPFDPVRRRSGEPRRAEGRA